MPVRFGKGTGPINWFPKVVQIIQHPGTKAVGYFRKTAKWIEAQVLAKSTIWIKEMRKNIVVPSDPRLLTPSQAGRLLQRGIPVGGSWLRAQQLGRKIV